MLCNNELLHITPKSAVIANLHHRNQQTLQVGVLLLSNISGHITYSEIDQSKFMWLHLKSPGLQNKSKSKLEMGKGELGKKKLHHCGYIFYYFPLGFTLLDKAVVPLLSPFNITEVSATLIEYLPHIKQMQEHLSNSF